MIYGLYLSATGVLTNSYRQDVIANNLANAETVGFKRDLALFQERRTAVNEMGLSPGQSSKLLEKLGGGTFASPTLVDQNQGELEHTGNPLDVAIDGTGYFTVKALGQTKLTRDGRFAVNRAGKLALAIDDKTEVLDAKGNSIDIGNSQPVAVGRDGTLSQDGKTLGRLGIVDVPDRGKITPDGATLLSYPDQAAFRASDSTVVGGYIEHGNVDPATELSQLMDAQRQLEANANMIRYQDQTLGKLVNEVGKIG